MFWRDNNVGILSEQVVPNSGSQERTLWYCASKRIQVVPLVAPLYLLPLWPAALNGQSFAFKCLCYAIESQ